MIIIERVVAPVAPTPETALAFEPTKTRALLRANESLPVFAYDKEDGTSKRTFLVAGWGPLLAHVVKLTSRNRGFFYELMTSWSPLRLYFDVECHAEGASAHASHASDGGAALAAVVDALSTSVDDVLRRHGLPTAPPVVLAGSRPTKCSCHVVFPNVVLVDRESVRALVDAVCATLPPRVVAWIDRGVYDRDRQLRILGSSKRARPVADRRPLRHGDAATIDVDALRRTLVTCVPVDAPRYRVASSAPSTPASTGRKRTVSKGFDAASTAAADRVEAHLRRRHPELRTVYRDRWQDKLEFTLCPGVPCPNNGGRAHSSNKTWFSVDLVHGFAHYTCCDPECRKQRTTFGQDNLKRSGVLASRFKKPRRVDSSARLGAELLRREPTATTTRLGLN